MVSLSPIVKLDARETFDVLKAVPIELAVVRLQDLVLKSSFKFKKTFHEVVSAGGLHNFSTCAHGLWVHKSYNQLEAKN